MIRAKYKRLSFSPPKAKCRYCQRGTHFALEFPNGDEVWACESCAWFHGKVKRFKKVYEGKIAKMAISNTSSEVK